MKERIFHLTNRSAEHRSILSTIGEGKTLYEELQRGMESSPPSWYFENSDEATRKMQAASNYEEYAQRLEDAKLARQNPSPRINAKMGYRQPKLLELMKLEGVGLEEAGPDMYKLHPGLGVNHFDDSIDASLERVIATISGIRTVEKEAVQTASNMAAPAFKKATGKMMMHASDASRAVAAGTKASKALRFRSAAAKVIKSRF